MHKHTPSTSSSATFGNGSDLEGGGEGVEEVMETIFVSWSFSKICIHTATDVLYISLFVVLVYCSVWGNYLVDPALFSEPNIIVIRVDLSF